MEWSTWGELRLAQTQLPCSHNTGVKMDCSASGVLWLRTFHLTLPGEMWLEVIFLLLGASIIGVNCHFDPDTSLETVKLMKEGLQAAKLKAHLMAQPLAFHTPDCGKQGFIDLPEFPFGKTRVSFIFFILFYYYFFYCLFLFFLAFSKTEVARCPSVQ